MTYVRHALLLSLLAAIPAAADTTITITQNGAACQVSAPADVAPPVTPSVAAGEAAEKNNDLALARANYRALAEKGDAEGERRLGILLMRRCTGLQDETAAVTWLGKAADAGDVPAQAELARAYMNGRGTAQDDGKAFALLSKAAVAGDVGAQVDLGYLYLSGRGVTADKYQGMAWTVKAGEKGAPAALFNIARGYFRGEALPQNTDNAVYYLAASLQRATPQQRVRFAVTSNNISRSVSAEDFKRIAERAHRWSPGPGSLSDVLRDADRQRKAG